MGNNWFGQCTRINVFLPSAPKIKSLKDKLVAKVFMTAFQRVKSNPAMSLKENPDRRRMKLL